MVGNYEKIPGIEDNDNLEPQKTGKIEEMGEGNVETDMEGVEVMAEQAEQALKEIEEMEALLSEAEKMCSDSEDVSRFEGIKQSIASAFEAYHADLGPHAKLISGASTVAGALLAGAMLYKFGPSSQGPGSAAIYFTLGAWTKITMDGIAMITASLREEFQDKSNI